MSEQQRAEQVEMLLKRCVSAESALRTISNHTWSRDQTLYIANRALTFCDEQTRNYVKRYPDSDMNNP